MDFLKDLVGFLKSRRKFWLFPAVIVLVFIGILIVIGGANAAAPFIYTFI